MGKFQIPFGERGTGQGSSHRIQAGWMNRKTMAGDVVRWEIQKGNVFKSVRPIMACGSEIRAVKVTHEKRLVVAQV